MYAVITGASSGIGKAIAFELASKNINVVLVARRKELLEQIKKEIKALYKVEVLIKTLDLGIKENAYKLHEETKTLKPEIFINNAGFGKVGFFTNIPLEAELSMLDLNIVGLHMLTKLYASSMEKGVILNVSSVAGFLPTPLMSTYAASKAYVLNLSKAVNFELKKQNKDVHVLALCPGPVKTEFGKVAEAGPSFKNGMSAEKCAKIAVNGIFKKKKVIVPGFQMKLLHFLIKIIPAPIVLKMAYKVQNNKDAI